MSYILDALRKSEQERRQIEAIGQVFAPDGTTRGSRPWLLWILTAALLVNGGVIGWLLLRGEAPVQTATPVATQAEVRSPVADAPEPRGVPALADVVGKPQALAAPAPAAAPPVQNQAETRPNLSAIATTSEPVTRSPVSTPEPYAPPLSSMPAEFQRSVPAINVSVHVFAQQPSARWVLIDGKRAHEGQQIAGGMMLERITPDGMVLRFRGERFAVNVR